MQFATLQTPDDCKYRNFKRHIQNLAIATPGLELTAAPQKADACPCAQGHMCNVLGYRTWERMCWMCGVCGVLPYTIGP